MPRRSRKPGRSRFHRDAPTMDASPIPGQRASEDESAQVTHLQGASCGLAGASDWWRRSPNRLHRKHDRPAHSALIALTQRLARTISDESREASRFGRFDAATDEDGNAPGVGPSAESEKSGSRRS